MNLFKRHALAAAMGLAALTFGAGAVQAAPLPAGGMTLPEVETWLHSLGLNTTSDAAHRAVVAKLSAQTVVVTFLTDCKQDRCTSLQYFFGVEVSQVLDPDDATAAVIMNKWNSTHRWLRAYVDDKRHMAIEMDTSISPGLDTDGLNSSLGTFVGGINVFRQYLIDTEKGMKSHV